MTWMELNGISGLAIILYIVFSLFSFNRSEDLNVNLKTSTLGWTPFHHAIFAGHANVIRCLVAYQADINARAGSFWGFSVNYLTKYECGSKYCAELSKP